MEFHIIAGFAAHLWFRGEAAKASETHGGSGCSGKTHLRDSPLDAARQTVQEGTPTVEKNPPNQTPLGNSHVNFQRKTR
jgi:hypothetical protein